MENIAKDKAKKDFFLDILNKYIEFINKLVSCIMNKNYKIQTAILNNVKFNYQ